MDRKKVISKTFKCIFAGVVAVQIVLGILWSAGNFLHVPDWKITQEYLEISKTFVMDEYVSIWYPLILRLFTELEQLTGWNYYIPVYLLQLSAALAVDYAFARGVLNMGKKGAWLAAGYLLTFPMLLQFHLSIRPESLRVSAVVALIVLFKKICCAKKKKMWKAVMMSGIILILFAGAFANRQLQTPGSRGRIQKTFWSAAFQRVVTDYFSRSYAIWDEDVRDVFTIEEAMEQAKRSDNMIYTVGPLLEKELGRRRADELYKEMALDCFRVRTKEVGFQICDDFVDSLLMPFSTWWQDHGTRKSQTGWNYGRFRKASPLISRFYWNYAILGLLVCVVGGIVTRILNPKVRYSGISLLPVAFLQCFLCVMSSGNRVNYSGLLLVILFWCVLGCNLYKDS